MQSLSVVVNLYLDVVSAVALYIFPSSNLNNCVEPLVAIYVSLKIKSLVEFILERP